MHEVAVAMDLLLLSHKTTPSSSCYQPTNQKDGRAVRPNLKNLVQKSGYSWPFMPNGDLTRVCLFLTSLCSSNLKRGIHRRQQLLSTVSTNRTHQILVHIIFQLGCRQYSIFTIIKPKGNKIVISTSNLSILSIFLT